MYYLNLSVARTKSRGHLVDDEVEEKNKIKKYMHIIELNSLFRCTDLKIYSFEIK